MYQVYEGKGKKMIKDRQIKLIIGSLLHDIGKVVYRSGDGRNHSQSGYDFLKTEAGIEDTEILNCVKYHHGAHLKNTSISSYDCAYITYFADNIAAAADRRSAENGEDGFDKTVPLDSIFNILNGNNGKCHYGMQVLNPNNPINYPVSEKITMGNYFYKEVIQNITDHLKGISLDEEYLNSLLSILEANLTYIPSSTSRRELADISLYDHLKMTAAIASCTEQYLEAEGEKDYRSVLFLGAEHSYKKEMFLLYSMDISGIQNFIYTIGEKGVLKGLRARSFYLELMMEHIIDELLEKLSLSRANLIYSGGGHCYMLLANTETTIEVLQVYEKQLNAWLLKNFDTALYVACGYTAATANSLKNIPQGSYSELYINVSRMISEKKSRRYDAQTIRNLNSRSFDGKRECKVCRRSGILKDDKCSVCNSLEKLSGNILKRDFFTVICKPEENALPLPGNMYLVTDTEESLRIRMTKDDYVRSYTKNKIYTGKHVTTKLWVGDYANGDTFEDLANQSEGVKRLGILRADVDNLGSTFVFGFHRPDGDDKYVTLSRTASLSRQLSLFFKYYINKILKNGEESILAKKGGRKVVIVYSGGDDVFLVGAWNEVIAAFVELKNALQRFTQDTLTISGGIGVYHSKYPLNVMAKEVARLEDLSKTVDGKNAITVFDKNHSYPWDEFLKKVLAEKLEALNEYFKMTEERGMAFLYHLMELLRNDQERINRARCAYLLSRMEPGEKAEKKEIEAYREFSRKVYEWSQKKEDRKELITAIYLYVYLNRKEGEEQNETYGRELC